MTAQRLRRARRARGGPIAGLRILAARFFDLAREPVFLALTLVGNATILAGALALYAIEHGVNPAIESRLDALWWAVATVTTVGYGDVSPITPAGKVMGIGLMIGGTALFWSFTALFAGALLRREIREVESDVEDLGESIEQSRSEIHVKTERLREVTAQLESALELLKRDIRSRR